MENNLVNSVVTVLTAIIGVAIIAVLVGTNAKTTNVIQAAAQGLAQDLGAAEAPVTGGGLDSLSSFTGGGVGTISNF